MIKIIEEEETVAFPFQDRSKLSVFEVWEGVLSIHHYVA
jgi:hypothetical protein